MCDNTAVEYQCDLLRSFSSLCAHAISCIEKEDIEGFNKDLEQRQAILDQFSAADRPPMELSKQYSEITRLLDTCVAMDARLNSAAKSYRQLLLKRMDDTRSKRKINSAYLSAYSQNKGKMIGKISG
ncbi:MAG: hypothetical protein VB078_09930 [Clostridiaceae bacterium]|nr:hypothetical protein [Clostridiaceae bacterium]